MSAANQRNGAVATTPIAPFRDLQIGVVTRCGQVAFSDQFVAVGAADGPDDIAQVVDAEKLIGFRDLLL